MATNSPIEWTTHTFNPWWGCVKVSDGCKRCYADTLARRYGHDVWGPGKPRRTFGEKHWAEPLNWNAAAQREAQRARVFCSSMADVFEDHPTAHAERPKLWQLIRATPWLDWQMLTKRPENIPGMVPPDWDVGYPNVWLGTSVEDDRVLSRVRDLVAVPAVVHFLSVEPLIGPIDRLPVHGIEWVIVGGESGPGARPMQPEWVESLHHQCQAAAVPFFFKQWGGVHKRRAGRTLHGRTYDELPTVLQLSVD